MCGIRKTSTYIKAISCFLKYTLSLPPYYAQSVYCKTHKQLIGSKFTTHLNKFAAYILLLGFALIGISAQAQIFNYKKYDIENSAADGDIQQIQQDNSGAIWWVNDESFTRYNGIVYQSISYSSIAANYRHTNTYIDNHGDLWLCASQNNKIDVYSYSGKWGLLSTFVANEDEVVQSFYATKISGNPWIVLSTNQRILTWDKGNWNELLLDESKEIYQVIASGNTIYVHTDLGLYVTRHGKNPYRLEFSDEITKNIKALYLYENIWLNGGEPQLWVLTDNMIGYVKNNILYGKTLFDNSQYHFTQLCNNGLGEVYLLSAENEIWLLDLATNEFEKIEGLDDKGKINETVNQLFIDRENNLWIAVDDGLIKTANQSISFITKKQGVSGLPVQAVARGGNTIIAAGPKGLNVLYDEKNINFFPFEEENLINPRQQIHQLKADSFGNVWMLSNTQGLWYTNNYTNWQQIGNQSNITAFEIGKDGKIYTVSAAGLFEAHPDGLILISPLPEGIKAQNIVWHNNALLLLTNKGIYRLSGKRWAKLVEEDGKPFSHTAYALEKVYDNLAILGTEKGIYYLKEFDLVKYSTDTVWGNRPYYGIAIDKKGAVWLASDTGIVVMEKKGAPRIFAYKGMQFAPHFNSPLVTGSDGNVWIGLRRGLMLYRPDYEKQSTNKPMLVVNKVESREVSSANFNSSSTVNLESDDNDLTFYFDANSFIDESKNKILYKLEGYMVDWEELANINANSISFKNLPAGQFTLKMQLINANGVAGDIISSPVININKPFYSQWWFYAVAIAAFFGVSFAIFYLYGQKKFENDLLLEVDKRSRELRSSEDRFRTLWENTSDALVLYNLRGEIIIYNQTFLGLVGHTEENLAGKKIHELFNISDKELSEKEFRHNLETQQLKPHFELKVSNKGGKGDGIVLEFSNTYLLLPNEKTWVMLSLIRNITQRKQTEENLIAAKNEAEQASRVKSAFLATMSHEIRTPLNAIIGMSSVMRNTQLSSEQFNYVNAIKTSSDSLLSLVSNILDFSKIEAGMMIIEKTDVSVEDCVTETIEILGNLANEKGIYLYYRIHPDVPAKIISDKTRLRQVLINLVGNAIKFTEAGYIEIAVKPDTNHQLKLSVTDTGIGIPKNKINGLFKVFTQVDDSTTRKYGGTGLGLAITDKLVNLLGGHIKVASQEGKGSQFSFSIKDFSKGKNTSRRGDSLRKYPDVELALVSPNKVVAHIFKTLNDERDIKTHIVASLADAVPLLPQVAAVLIDAEHLTTAEMPPQLAESELLIIKRNLKKLPPTIEALLGGDKYKTLSIPIGAQMYQRILESALRKTPVMSSSTEAMPKPVIKKTDPKKDDQPKFGDGMPLKILVVDDNKVNLMMMEVIMKNLGYKVDFANNGKEAVAMCTENDYQLVFMDVQMPEMDGIEATQMIKAGDNSELPAIVALTANAFPEDKQACLDAGMIDFLPKPVTIDTIKELITKLYSKISKTVG